MRKVIIAIAVSFFLSACSTTSTPVNDRNVTVEIDKEIAELLQNTDAKPLDLTEYKEVQYKIMKVDDVNYIVVSYEDYTKIIELLSKLNGHIKVQKVTIDELQNFLQRRIQHGMDRQKVD